MKRHALLVAIAAMFPAGDAFGGIIFFTGGSAQTNFHNAASAAGQFQKSFEDFEGGTIPNGTSVVLASSILRPGTSNIGGGFGFPTGLGAPNLTYQINTGGANAAQPAPFGGGSLRYHGAGVGNFVSDVVTTGPDQIGNFTESMDLIFSGNNKTAVGFHLISDVPTGASLLVKVYDINNVLIQGGVGIFAGVPQGSRFLGVLATGADLIGRINIYDPNRLGSVGADNIEMYLVPLPPAAWIGALGLLGVIVWRRKIL